MATPNSSALGDYGMPVGDYLVEVTDPTTDQPASGAAQQACDTAAMTRTAPRAIVKFTTNGTGVPTLVLHEAQWGIGTTPVVARTGVGMFTITWPVTVVDELGVSQSVNLRFTDWPALDGVVGVNLATATVTAPNVVTVYQVNISGGPVAADSTGVSYTVVAR
jgi:hypothetical protein